MGFNFFEWLHRRQVESQFAGQHHRVQAVRVTNPFHAVGIKPCDKPCPSAQSLRGRRFLSAEAPRLPLPDCAAGACGCVYLHYEDRRSGADRRRVQAGGLRKERRGGQGRRATDH